MILTWQLAQERRQGCTQAADRRATRTIAVSFFALAAYVGVESSRDLLGRVEPEVSLPGIVLAALSLVVMPRLAGPSAKSPGPGVAGGGVGGQPDLAVRPALGRAAGGLAANAALGWWWADPATGLGIAALAAIEGVRTWRAESLADACCDSGLSDGGCCACGQVRSGWWRPWRTAPGGWSSRRR